ncbi:MAG: hypothetical protein ACK5MH_03740 [Bacteroidales bacterium]|jgi:hypothetical protein
MPGIAIWLGGFLRWLWKGCKTRLRDEVYMNDIGNYIIGLVTTGIILGIVIWGFF